MKRALRPIGRTVEVRRRCTFPAISLTARLPASIPASLQPHPSHEHERMPGPGPEACRISGPSVCDAPNTSAPTLKPECMLNQGTGPAPTKTGWRQPHPSRISRLFAPNDQRPPAIWPGRDAPTARRELRTRASRDRAAPPYDPQAPRQRRQDCAPRQGRPPDRTGASC